MSASSTLQDLIKGEINEKKYLHDISRRKLSSDIEYLYKSNDISLFSDEFEKNLLNDIGLSYLNKYLFSSNFDDSKIVNEMVSRYDQAKEKVENFINNNFTDDVNKEDIAGLNKILNDNNSVSFKWWEINNKYQIGNSKMSTIVAGLENSVKISNKKITKSKCKKEVSIPIAYINDDRYTSINFIDREYKDKYYYRGNCNNKFNQDKIMSLEDDKRDKMIAILTDSNCVFDKLPDSVVQQYYNNNEKKAIEKARKKSEVKERLKSLGIDDIEDEIVDTCYNDLVETFSTKSLKNRNVRHYNADNSVNKIQNNMSNLPNDKLKEIWDKEYQYTNDSDETSYQKIPDVCTDTVLNDIAWDLPCLSVIDTETKAKIMKSKIRKANSSKTTHSISWPSFDIDKSVLDELTALQLSKFVNLIPDRDADNLDLANKNFYKQKLSRKMFKGDDRAKKAMNKIDNALSNDQNKDNSNISNKSNNSKSRSSRGIMKEKAEKAHKQIKSWLKDFTSYGDMIQFVKEENQELLDESVFEKIWEKTKHSNSSNRLRYSEKKTSKSNLKIVKELSNKDFQDFTIPEVDD